MRERPNFEKTLEGLRRDLKNPATSVIVGNALMFMISDTEQKRDIWDLTTRLERLEDILGE